MHVPDVSPMLRLDSSRNLICSRESTTLNYTAWAPAVMEGNPSSTNILMNFGSNSEAVTRFIFLDDLNTVNRGFRSRISDKAVLEIKEGALFAHLVGVDISTPESSPVRLGPFRMDTNTGTGQLTGEMLNITFDSAENSCSVTTGSGINTTLSPGYCNASDTNTIAMLSHVSPLGDPPASGPFDFACISMMSVTSLP